MKSFKSKEILIVLVVLSVVFVLSFFNLRTALRRARDFQRKDDVNNIAKAVFLFKEDFGFYPPSASDGRIIACGEAKELPLDANANVKAITDAYVPCRWGWDGLADISDSSYAPYLERIPADPQNFHGASYRYSSTLSNFQIFASLESSDEDEYNASIAASGFICGSRICNYGRASPRVPLDKSLEEYENEIRTINNEQ
ncbi:hypothetical protein A2125_01685 [Candidatus Woesebacteria bacterium GWB1_43_5]|uniref:Type II secretion system protein GspG C-terminal domain-containing protein n=1 Tax=Candidatus Woesebacteria bacterium GWB1_43_5 TaxID=1802474 RepID=A0A1F7WSX8_9BACT|nr:MAG: hypothetical protein A2125_01685 [Candidatus Woesebacteria bacterium GWB1_43_5]